MKVRALFLCIFLTIAGYAQTGNYFLSHFSPDEERNIMCFDIVQDNRGVFYFATQAGILQFDGRNWDLIATPGTIYSIARADDGIIYVAGSEGFGKISNDDFGMEVYQSLYKQEGAEYIFQIITLPSLVYFLGDRNLFTYSIQSGEIDIQPATERTGLYVALHEIFGKIYVSSEQKGLFQFEGELVNKASIGIADSTTLIFALKWGDTYLLGTDDNRVYTLKENQKIKEIPLQDAVYANAGVIVNATWINDKLVAIGTLRGGVMFINPVNGKTEEIINYNTGLPDNEIFSIIADKNQNVWAAHAHGFTRIAPYLPFRSFRYYPGLEGNLLCATTQNDQVFVGTSVGLYKLEKEEFYDEITYFVNVPVKVKAGKKNTIKQKEQEVVPIETEDKKGGFFRFLRKKKKEEEIIAPPTTITKNQPSQPKQTYRREKRSKKILREAYFKYKKVSGVDSKITQLIHWQNKFIAAGLGGAYEINGNDAVQIIQEPVRFLFAPKKSNTLIAATYDDKLHQFKFDKAWNESGVIENISIPVNYIFEEDDAALWFCGFYNLFRMSLTDKPQHIETLTIDKHSFDQPLGICFNKEVFISTTSGFYKYDAQKGSLIEGDTLRKPKAYFANSSTLWYRDDHRWQTAGQTGEQNNLQLLNLFNNIRFIDSDVDKRSLWIITGGNELLQFNSEAQRKDEILFPLILKSIENDNKLLPRRSSIKIEQDKSSLRIEVIRPDFIGARFIEYRYRLDGLNSKWSDWSVNNNVVPFPYLPTGEYKLYIESKDIFGRTNQLDPVSLEVVPPYWKQTWFFAAEFSVFVFLVILSFRLSYRFLFISRVLSLLSIIIFIEFIQTIAGSAISKSTPIIDFAIQVGIAFLILPIEGFLRRHFLQAINKRNLKLQQAGQKIKKAPHEEQVM
jgi:hypothetical protein